MVYGALPKLLFLRQMTLTKRSICPFYYIRQQRFKRCGPRMRSKWPVMGLMCRFATHGASHIVEPKMAHVAPFV